MSEGMTALRSRMQEADEVKIIGPATQLTFSLKGIDAVACGGTHNIPDGEVFSCPVRDMLMASLLLTPTPFIREARFQTLSLISKTEKSSRLLLHPIRKS